MLALGAGDGTCWALRLPVVPPPKIVNVRGFLPDKSCQELGLWLALDCWMLPVHCSQDTGVESFLPGQKRHHWQAGLGWKLSRVSIRVRVRVELKNLELQEHGGCKRMLRWSLQGCSIADPISAWVCTTHGVWGRAIASCMSRGRGGV